MRPGYYSGPLLFVHHHEGKPMAFTVELEEWVGSVWHRFITRRASPDFPEARVELAVMQRPLALLFRAMGGASGIGVEAASPRQLLLRRNLLIYGLGGIIVPFIGIKLIDLVLAAFGWV